MLKFSVSAMSHVLLWLPVHVMAQELQRLGRCGVVAIGEDDSFDRIHYFFIILFQFVQPNTDITA